MKNIFVSTGLLCVATLWLGQGAAIAQPAITSGPCSLANSSASPSSGPPSFANSSAGPSSGPPSLANSSASPSSGPPSFADSSGGLSGSAGGNTAGTGTAQNSAGGSDAGPGSSPKRMLDPVKAPSVASTIGGERRGLAPPLDPAFPSTEFVGSAGQSLIGVPDTPATYPLEKMLWKTCPLLQRARVHVYGWTNPGYNWSTSHKSNIPLSYAIAPRSLQLDQLILRLERVPDTVQTEHWDWGFRFSNLFGIDYRWTTAQGWNPASSELLKHNKLYGYDPVECYGLLYLPKIKNGMMLKFGRYISPPDIEAQLAPDNYLWSHSLMFTYDCYTHTGLLASIQLNPQWMVQAGIHAGDDIAPWDKAAIPTGEAYVRWQSKSGSDSFYGGVNSFNNGAFRLGKEIRRAQELAAANGTAAPRIPGHDNLQQYNITWSHRFNRRVHMATEGYFIWQRNALVGGTVNNGPPHKFLAGTGAGAPITGLATSWGVVNYLNIKLSKKDYITLRPIDYLGDTKGERTGFATAYASWTLGWVHHFNDLLTIRPEIRYEQALNSHHGVVVKPYDNGTRRRQFTVGFDLIQRF